MHRACAVALALALSGAPSCAVDAPAREGGPDPRAWSLASSIDAPLVGETSRAARTAERLEERSISIVTTSVTAEDGSRYVAGTFSGTLVLGSAVLHARGGRDLFLARLEPSGEVAWARVVGGPADEADPKVSFEDGRVILVGTTDGAVDCGRGELSTWSSETFFLCTFDGSGAPLNGGAFPTGSYGQPWRSPLGRPSAREPGPS